MTASALLELVATPADAAPIQGAASARFIAPSRFDVHEIPEFTTWIADRPADADVVVLDLGDVVFLDCQMMAAIDEAVVSFWTGDSRLSVQNPSLAALITFELVAIADGLLDHAVAA